MLRKHRGLNYSSLFSPHSYKTLSENENNINLSIHAAAHLRKKGQCSSVIANIILKHYPHTSLVSHSVYCENFWRPLVTQHVFSGKRKSVIWFLSMSTEKAWAQSSYSIETIYSITCPNKSREKSTDIETTVYRCYLKQFYSEIKFIEYAYRTE